MASGSEVAGRPRRTALAPRARRGKRPLMPQDPIPDALREAALVSKAWPYEEARKLLKRYPDGPGERAIVFETGYGPSGLPHLGTFQEVARTLMVRHALVEMTGWPTRLIAFSDDMDGMRKVPPGAPEQEMMLSHLDRPLSVVPDPYGGCHQSYAAHNNGLLRQFLDRFSFDYEFLSSTDCYASGRFDEVLRQVLRKYQAIMDIMLPTLREERQRTYSPVLPVSRVSGKVLQVTIEVVDPEAGTVRYVEPETNEAVEQSILSGGAKLQWKVDWAARWVALNVDYEMAGKDHIDGIIQSGKIARALGGRPPEGFNYELFLDENGEKISKTKGNGVTIDEWLTYAPRESLAFYIYREPKRAKQLSFAVIPKAVDEYYQSLALYAAQPWDKRLGNPVHHIHGGDVPAADMPVSFALLLNIASLPGVGDRETIWSFLKRYRPGLSPQSSPELDKLVGHAVAYGCRFIAPGLNRRAPTPEEAAALRELDRLLGEDDGTGRTGEDPAAVLQNHIYEIGKAHYGKERLRDWFKALYETLLGSEQGPRMGSFIALYGVDNSRRLIASALSGEAGA